MAHEEGAFLEHLCITPKHSAVKYVIFMLIFMQKVQFCFALSGNRFTFTTEFRRHWGGVWKDFTEKGVIEINNL